MRYFIIIILLGLAFHIEAAKRVTAFYGSWMYWSGFRTSNIDFARVTHVIYSFLKPTGGGGVSDGHMDAGEISELNTLITQAHSRGVLVLISIGGANDSRNFPAIAASSRTAFANNLKNYCQSKGLDGVDIDWEFPSTGQDRENFTLLMRDIRQAFGSSLILTADLPQDDRLGQYIASSSFQYADWFHIMAYDNTGSWHGSPVGPHSSIGHAINGLNYWTGKGMPKDKAVLGVPFYGKNFDNGGNSIDYKSIINQFNPTPDINQVGNIYFNGLDLIKQKTKYIVDKDYGGVMIWEINQDAGGGQSLLSGIDFQIKQPPDTSTTGGIDNGVPILDTEPLVTSGSGYARLNIENQGTMQWSVQARQGPFTLNVGQGYHVSFDMWAGEERQIMISINGMEQPVSLGTAPFTFEFPLSVSSTVTNADIQFNAGLSSSADVFYDNVSIITSGGTELITNGSMDAGLTGWSLYRGEGGLAKLELVSTTALGSLSKYPSSVVPSLEMGQSFIRYLGLDASNFFDIRGRKAPYSVPADIELHQPVQ